MEIRFLFRVSSGGVCSIFSTDLVLSIIGADVRLERVRRIASETSSTASGGSGYTLLRRADVNECANLDLIVVYGGAYELVRRFCFSLSIAALVFWISKSSRSSVVKIFCFMRVLVNFGLTARVVVVDAGICVKSS